VRFVFDKQLRDSAVLFSLFSRRKKIASPDAESAPVPVDPIDVVEPLPAAAVVTPSPVEVVEPDAVEVVQLGAVEPEDAVREDALTEHPIAEDADQPSMVVTTVEDGPAVALVVAPAPDEAETADQAAPVAEVSVAEVAVSEVPVAEVAVAEVAVTTSPSTPPSVPSVTRPPTVPELRAKAKALGLTGYSRLPKAELLRVIAEHQAK
jgi:hypothetical protein